jgi:pimeloyl-ACP methyl ester carboxylesterase
MKANNIVLVHGAFADASCWSKVIPLLLAAGYHVTAVQNPLSSVEADVATTKRVLEAQDGPTLVVAHSYGGIVASQAAFGSENVKGLVFLAAFVPDEGETTGELLQMAPGTTLQQAIRPDSAGFAYIDRAQFKEIFCADLSDEEAAVLAVTQHPVHGSTFGAQAGPVAWKSVPTWYAVSDHDQCINPELERLMAERISAQVRHFEASHVAMLSIPDQVAELIKEAASA